MKKMKIYQAWTRRLGYQTWILTEIVAASITDARKQLEVACVEVEKGSLHLVKRNPKHQKL